MSRYTPEQVARRRASKWTIVQAILAPVQFLVFLISAGLVIYSLTTGQGYALTNASIVVKIAVLYAIMITGMLWEKEVFGHYVFAPEFFWEDAMSTVVMIVHTAYPIAALLGASERQLLWVILFAYATYLINAGQYVVKLLVNRRQIAAGKAGEAASRPSVQGGA